MPDLKIGTRYCLCAKCGRYFTSPSAFDMHRAGKPESRYCRDPAKILDAERKPRMRLTPSGYWASARRRVEYLDQE
jgi:hypothetical protein